MYHPIFHPSECVILKRDYYFLVYSMQKSHQMLNSPSANEPLPRICLMNVGRHVTGLSIFYINAVGPYNECNGTVKGIGKYVRCEIR